jgi:hypothetical protein
MSVRRLAVVAVILSAAVAAGLSAVPAPAPAYRSVSIKDVPHVLQKPDFCGEACAEMVLARLGKKFTQDDVFNLSGIDPALGRGCHAAELAKALGRVGFRVGDFAWRVTAARAASTGSGQAAEEMEAQWRALHADLLQGVPSIVCMHTSDGAGATEHFRLVLGYDTLSDEVLYHDPAVEGGTYLRMGRQEFLKLWPLKYEANSWTVVRLRLEPGEIRDPPARTGLGAADFAQRVMAIKKRMPPEGFSLAIAPPFVVIGDEPAATVRLRAEQVVKWTVERLKADFFRKDPDAIIAVWLFKDDASYEHHAKAIFGDSPTTPYGYYSSQHQALIMNIATGGGTLVHEIVHPFMRTNFPACPDWFNEGLGSLYEQSEDKNGHIHGRTNWRLPGLQKTIAAGTLLSFKDLAATTTDQFYNHDKGANYAQARYLCYYLQEKGLLVKFYHEFVAHAADDPTGYKTLQRVLGKSDMAGFQKRWEAWVLKLTFP